MNKAAEEKKTVENSMLQFMIFKCEKCQNYHNNNMKREHESNGNKIIICYLCFKLLKQSKQKEQQIKESIELS